MMQFKHLKNGFGNILTISAKTTGDRPKTETGVSLKTGNAGKKPTATANTTSTTRLP